MSTTPDPMDLWRQAGGGTKKYSPQRYHDLMVEHGHILRPGDEGYEDAPRSAPCGWPHAGSTGADEAQPLSPDAGEAQGHTDPLSASLPPCPTPCDADCELGPDGCHEIHQMHGKRGHQPEGCQEIRQAIARAVAAYENAITWNTSCLGCATLLDSCYAETTRREQAEAKLAKVRAECGMALGGADPADAGLDEGEAFAARVLEILGDSDG